MGMAKQRKRQTEVTGNVRKNTEHSLWWRRDGAAEERFSPTDGA